METVKMSYKELKRLPIIIKAINKQISQKQAGEILGLSYRQIKRIVKTVKEKGIEGLCHKNRGRPSSRKIKRDISKKIVELYKENYPDFGPTLAQEKLEERDNIKISREALRQLLIKQELWKVRKKRKKVLHIWRQRRSSEGELVQIDGSHHRWLEDRLDQEFCLMAYIDDATSKVFAHFYEYEGIYPILDSFKRFIKQIGRPRAIYIDRHSTYKTTRKASIDEELENSGSQTQFQQVMKDLDIEVIYAQSPQAKGRIERLFSTFQDRLVKEMRLSKIISIKEANKFLEKYLVIYNKRFCVPARETKPLWQPIQKNLDEKWIFATRHKRIIQKDYTIKCFNRLFLIKNPYLALQRQKVEIKIALNGDVRFTTKHKILEVKEISELVPKYKKESFSQSLKKLRRITTTHAKSKKTWMDGFYFGNQYRQIMKKDSTLIKV